MEEQEILEQGYKSEPEKQQNQNSRNKITNNGRVHHKLKSYSIALTGQNINFHEFKQKKKLNENSPEFDAPIEEEEQEENNKGNQIKSSQNIIKLSQFSPQKNRKPMLNLQTQQEKIQKYNFTSEKHSPRGEQLLQRQYSALIKPKLIVSPSSKSSQQFFSKQNSGSGIGSFKHHFKSQQKGTYPSQNMSDEEKRLHDQLTNVLQSISDVFNKQQLLEAMKSLETQDQRTILVDRILERREQIKDTHQIMQIKKVIPLVNRFVKKLQQKKEQTLGKNHSYQINTPQASQHMGEKEAQDFEQKLQTHASSLQMFFESMRKKSENSPNSQDELSSVRSKKNKLKKSMSSETNATNNPKSSVFTGNKHKKINYLKVSDKSKQLIKIGHKKQVDSSTGLLSDFQVKNLSSHFKSKLENSKNVDTTDLNTYQIANQNRITVTTPRGLLYKQDVFSEVMNNIEAFVDSQQKKQEFFIHPNKFETKELQILELRSKNFTQDNQDYFRNIKNLFKERKERASSSNLMTELAPMQQFNSNTWKQQYLHNQEKRYVDKNSLEQKALKMKSQMKDQNINCGHTQVRYHPQPLTRRTNQLQIKLASKLNTYANQKEQSSTEQNCEALRDDRVDFNDSFASYTEIKLDQLYRESKQLQQQKAFAQLQHYGDKNKLLNMSRYRNRSQQNKINPEKIKQQKLKTNKEIKQNYKNIISISKQKWNSKYN